MANQIFIDIGAAANDGTGDPLRTAFDIVNDNFSNVWSTGLPTSNITFSNNRILTVTTNGNLILAPNGTGKVQSNVDIVPNINAVHSLGAIARRWNTVYTQFIDVSGDTEFAGDVTIAGNLIVEGDTIQIGNIVTDTKTIQLSNTASTANAANGSGITVGAADNIATIIYNSTSNTWTTNIGVSATGNITAPYFIGNGSALTGISSYSNANVVTLLANFGSNTVSTTGNITTGNLTVSSEGNIWTIAGRRITGPGGAYWRSNPDQSADDFVSAPGSNIRIQSINSSNAVESQINLTSTNIVFTIDNGISRTWRFNETGITEIPGDITPVTAGGGDANVGNASNPWTNAYFSGTINSGNIVPTGNNTQSLGNITNQWADLYISNATIFMNGVPISLGAGNVLTVDGNDVVTTNANGTVDLANLAIDNNNIYNTQGQGVIISNFNYVTAEAETAYVTIPAGNSSADLNIVQEQGNVVINASGNAWTFDTNGDLSAPGNFVGAGLLTSLAEFNWSAGISNIATGATTAITLDSNVFGDPWSGQITIEGVGGATEANATWWYQATDSNSLALYTDSSFTTPVDSSAWGVYTSGGIAYTIGYNNIEINARNVTIRSDHGDYNNRVWGFDSTGSTRFPYMDVARGDSTGSNITGFVLKMGDGTAEGIISTPDGNPQGGQSSQRLVINPGKGQDGTSGEGGDIYLWAGRGGDAGGSGGDIKIRGGQGMSGGGGGYIRIEAGDSQGDTGPAGYVQIVGGTTTGGSPGYVEITGGQNSNGPGGNANITGGYAFSGSGGAVNITGGISNDGLASYGNVLINSGANTWTFDNTGVLTLPGEGILQSINDTVTLKSFNTSTGNANSVYMGSAGGLGFFDQEIGGNWLEIFRNGAEPQITVPVGRGNLNIQTAEGESSYNWVFDNAGDLSAPGNITTTGTVSGQILVASQSAANEGGEIQLALPSSGTTLTGNVIIDSYQNQIRLFESGNSRGLFVDVPNVSASGQFAIGYRDVPQIALTGNVTANSITAGKHFYSTTAGNLQVTIPDNANVAFPLGATLTIVMNAAGNVIVAQGTGVSLYMAGSSSTGNRTVGAYGLASVMKVATDTWVISGTGVY